MECALTSGFSVGALYQVDGVLSVPRWLSAFSQRGVEYCQMPFSGLTEIKMEVLAFILVMWFITLTDFCC